MEFGKPIFMNCEPRYHNIHANGKINTKKVQNRNSFIIDC